MKIGYSRISTSDQDLSLQLDALEGAGCEKIFRDIESGRKASRPGLDDALSHLRKGDVLVVWRLDRLGRNAKSLFTWVETLEQRGIEFQSLTDGIDTTSIHGKFFFGVMAALAQLERDLIAERTRAGLAAAKKRGRLGGRPAKMTKSKIESAKKLFESGKPPREIAADLGISIATLYRKLPAADRA